MNASALPFLLLAGGAILWMAAQRQRPPSPT